MASIIRIKHLFIAVVIIIAVMAVSMVFETLISKTSDIVVEVPKIKVPDLNEGFTWSPLPEDIRNKIRGVSWKPDCPVAMEDLANVEVLYWGFDDKIHKGEIIVHKEIAREVVEIFKDLYTAKFFIEKIRLIDEYGADDNLSMADNNTSGFCFREVPGKQGKLSKHSYGLAIDINPVQNPYIVGENISPPEGKNYTNRENVRKGMIVKDDACYKAFKDRGWTWGGDWKFSKDYQHFQKAN